MELAVVVGETLAQVEVTALPLAVLTTESGTEHGDGTGALDGEVDVLGGVGKAGAVPLKVS